MKNQLIYSSMNTILLLKVVTFLAIIPSCIFAQKTSPIFEKQCLWVDSTYDKCLTVKGDTSVYLQVLENIGTVFDTLNIHISPSLDTSYTLAQKKKFDKKPFRPSLFDLKSETKLRGIFVQKDNQIRFYPEPWNEDRNSEEAIDIAKKRNKKINKHEFYIVEIPKHTVVKTDYSAFHFGAMTIPAKFFIKSKSQLADTVTSAQFGVNLNFMIGGQWGKRRYYHVEEQKKGDYVVSKSANLVFGISPLNLRPETTEDKVQSEITVAALSIGTSMGLHYKSIGLYVITGMDIPLSRFGKHWIFKRTPWLGFGLGLGI